MRVPEVLKVGRHTDPRWLARRTVDVLLAGQDVVWHGGRGWSWPDLRAAVMSVDEHAPVLGPARFTAHSLAAGEKLVLWAFDGQLKKVVYAYWPDVRRRPVGRQRAS